MADNNLIAPEEHLQPSTEDKDTLDQSPIEEKRVACRLCDEPISPRAKVCHHCGRPQSAWKIHHLELASLINAIVAFGLLILGALQFDEAKQDRVKAGEALKKATRAAKTIETILDNQRATSIEINNTFSNLFSDICDAFDGAFDSNSYTCVLPNGKTLKYSLAVSEPETSKEGGH